MTQSLKLMVTALVLASGTILTYAQPGRAQAQTPETRSQEARPAATETPREEWSVTERSVVPVLALYGMVCPPT